MRLAYFAYPHLGGTFSVFRHLRRGLAYHGVDVRWVGLGADAQRSAADPMWAAEQATGLVVEAGDDSRGQAAALVREIERHGFDGVFVNIGGDFVQASAVRHLPRHVLRILIAHNITPGVHAAARALRDSVHAGVGVVPRIRNDLIRHSGFDPDFTVAIPNATDFAETERPRPPRAEGPFRLLSLGRVEDASKGVFWLPAILDRVPADVTLTVAGDGPDLARLRALFAPLGDRVGFLGAVPPSRATDLFANHDAIIAPSRFEGMPVTMLEAMAAGCVPVASNIHGVMDEVVQDGMSGMLFPVGDVAAAARCIARLRGDRALVDAMAEEGQARARALFRIDLMAVRYHRLIRRLAAQPPPVAEPLPIADWVMPSGLRPGLRTYLPSPVKNFLRTYKERLAL